MARNLMLAGNYNITNTDELFNALIDLGQQPKEKSDNVLMLEKLVILLTKKTSDCSAF